MHSTKPCSTRWQLRLTINGADIHNHTQTAVNRRKSTRTLPTRTDANVYRCVRARAGVQRVECGSWFTLPVGRAGLEISRRAKHRRTVKKNCLPFRQSHGTGTQPTANGRSLLSIGSKMADTLKNAGLFLWTHLLGYNSRWFVLGRWVTLFSQKFPLLCGWVVCSPATGSIFPPFRYLELGSFTKRLV